jgi:hypothetical protein
LNLKKIYHGKYGRDYKDVWLIIKNGQNF